MHELVNDPDMLISLHYIETRLQKGDMFTKALSLQTFQTALRTIGMMQRLEKKSELQSPDAK